jgi:hypothetical protein
MKWRIVDIILVSNLGVAKTKEYRENVWVGGNST